MDWERYEIRWPVPCSVAGMVTETLTPQSFSDADNGLRPNVEAVGRVAVADQGGETDDPLAAVRGLIRGLALCAPFWLVVLWVLL